MNQDPSVRARRLEGRAAMVTGASGAMGAAIARRLAAEGAAVALLARRESVCADLAEQIAQTGAKAIAARADVTDAASLRDAVRAVTDAFGRLDVVVANAGVETVMPFTALRDRDWDQALGVNLKGAANTVKAAMAPLAREGGSVVMMSSVAGLTGAAGLSAYAAAKGGVVALARSMARELAPRGIRVNTVAPGMVRTDMLERITKRWGPDQVEAMRKAHLLGFGEPEDVAAAVAFLASDDARWITGSVLVVDGGVSLT